MNDKKDIQEIAINASAIIGSTYSQLVGVTVTDVDITLEFVYLNQRDRTKGQVVSRVTLPRNVGADLANTILTTLGVHDKKKKGKNND